MISSSHSHEPGNTAAASTPAEPEHEIKKNNNVGSEHNRSMILFSDSGCVKMMLT
jgi:hypothetical protein